LIELMAVVAITGLLAVASYSLFRKQLLASKGSEAVTVIQAIRAAQEAYSAENHVYLNVSTASGGTLWYPKVPPRSRAAWEQSSPLDFSRWQAPAPAVNRPMLFGYLVNAGEPGTTVPAFQPLAAPIAFPSPMIVSWYTIQATGDVNGNGIFAKYAASSLNNEIVIENEGE